MHDPIKSTILEKELHEDTRCELPDVRDVLFEPLSLMELSHNKVLGILLYTIL